MTKATREIPALRVDFNHDGGKYLLEIHRYHYAVRRYEFQLWGGSIGLSFLGEDPRVPVSLLVSPSADLLKAALKAIKASCKESGFRRKLNVRQHGLSALCRDYVDTQGGDSKLGTRHLQLMCAVTRR